MGRKKRRKKRKKNQSNFIMPFFLTLILIVSAGVFMMLGWLYLCKQEEPAEENYPKTQETKPAEPVEEKDGEKRDEEEDGSETEEGAETPVDDSRYADVLQDEAYMAEHNIYAKEAFSEEYVTLLFAGDILFDPNYSVMAKVLQNGGDIGNGIAPDLIGEMQSADIMMLNNEFAYSDRGAPTPEKQFTFQARPDSVAYLTDMGDRKSVV